MRIECKVSEIQELHCEWHKNERFYSVDCCQRGDKRTSLQKEPITSVHNIDLNTLFWGAGVNNQ